MRQQSSRAFFLSLEARQVLEPKSFLMTWKSSCTLDAQASRERVSDSSIDISKSSLGDLGAITFLCFLEEMSQSEYKCTKKVF